MWNSIEYRFVQTVRPTIFSKLLSLNKKIYSQFCSYFHEVYKPTDLSIFLNELCMIFWHVYVVYFYTETHYYNVSERCH